MNAQLPMIVAGELPAMLRYPNAGRAMAALSYQRGEIDSNDNGGPRWRIEGSPVVIVAAMKVMSGVKSRKRDTCSFPATQANFEDLVMLMHRYPMRVDQRAGEMFDRCCNILTMLRSIR